MEESGDTRNFTYKFSQTREFLEEVVMTNCTEVLIVNDNQY